MNLYIIILFVFNSFSKISCCAWQKPLDHPSIWRKNIPDDAVIRYSNSWGQKVFNKRSFMGQNHPDFSQCG